MSEIKRYDLVYSEYMGGGIGVKENGKYCLHDDYLEVLKRAETAEQKLATSSGEQAAIGVVRRGEVDDSNSYPDCRVVCLHDQADWENFPDGTELFLQPPQAPALEELVPESPTRDMFRSVEWRSEHKDGLECYHTENLDRMWGRMRRVLLRNIQGAK